MSDNTNNGGPAFPTVGDIWDYDTRSYRVHTETSGVTIRDYFAAKAMQAMCDEVSRYNQFLTVAKDAYKMADAMLEARG